MDLLPLRYFQVVARYEHISRAAEELRVAQPSVSRTVARLEHELGTPLFDRQGRRVQLNAYGRIFLRHVERALRELDDARTALRDARESGLGSVSVAAETLLTLTGVLATFRRARPGTEVRLYQSTAAEMERQLRAGEVDLCLASQPLNVPSLLTVELLHEEVLLAVPQGHRLAGRPSVAVAELADEPFITTRPGNWQRTLLDRLFAAEGLTPVITCESNEPGASQDLISVGLGIGLIPAMSRLRGTHAPVDWVRVDAPACHRTLTLVRRADAYLSAAARAFLDHTTGRPFAAHWS